MLLPSGRFDVDLATLEQSTLDPSSSSRGLVRSGPHILSSKSTKGRVEFERFQLSPNRQDVVWMQRNAIRNAPEERKADHTGL